MKLSYKQLKWLILFIPTITIGLWEYIRHEYLLPYISMELGNILAPVLVLAVTLMVSTQLFAMIEHIQVQLNKSKALEAVLKERERIAQQLHDGIAQSMFFINVQLKHIEAKKQYDEQVIRKLQESIVKANEYVRQAIAGLRHSADNMSIPWLESIESLIKEIRSETDLIIHTNWDISSDVLNEKEKVELLAIMRETLLNIYKHANATEVAIQLNEFKNGWECKIVDNGEKFKLDDYNINEHFGIKIIKERAQSMNWTLHFKYSENRNLAVITKGEIIDDRN